MSIIADLVSVPDAVDGGKVAIERFDYQTAWGLSLVLSRHAAGAPYAVGFEFHDDIVELDHHDSPAKASFYQVKTDKAGNWTLARVAARRKKAGSSAREPSIAGRMWDNLAKFGAVVDRLVLVSNLPFTDLGSDYGDYPFASAPADKRRKFVAALGAECPGFAAAQLPTFHFSYSRLNLGSYDKAIVGEMRDFVHEATGLEDLNVKSFTLSLVDQCVLRSRRLSELGDFEALKRGKFFTRPDMERWLEELRAKYGRRVEWAEIAPWLALPHQARAIKAEWVRYEAERRRRLGMPAMKFQAEVLRRVAPHLGTGQPLYEMLDAALPDVRAIAHLWSGGSVPTDDYLRAMILYEYFHV